MPRVVVYTMDGCPVCARAKEYLAGRGVDYEERNVSRSEEHYRELVEGMGLRSVPVIIVDGERLVGFDEPVLRRLLERGEG